MKPRQIKIGGLLCGVAFIAANVSAQPPQIIEINTGDSGGAVYSAAPAPSSVNKGSELLLLVQQLQDEVRALRGVTEQQAFQIRKMEAEQLDRYRDLDRRISSLLASGTSNTQKESSTNTASPVPAVVSSAPQVNPVDDTKAYKEAFDKVRAKDFEGAVAGFKEFVTRYPNSPRLVNAHYWLGEIYQAQKQDDLAKSSFELVIKGFPDSTKAPHAAYKLGVIYRNAGDQKTANEYFDMVLKNYPRSNVVPLVKELRK